MSTNKNLAMKFQCGISMRRSYSFPITFHRLMIKEVFIRQTDDIFFSLLRGSLDFQKFIDIPNDHQI